MVILQTILFCSLFRQLSWWHTRLLFLSEVTIACFCYKDTYCPSDYLKDCFGSPTSISSSHTTSSVAVVKTICFQNLLCKYLLTTVHTKLYKMNTTACNYIIFFRSFLILSNIPSRKNHRVLNIQGIWKWWFTKSITRNAGTVWMCATLREAETMGKGKEGVGMVVCIMVTT